MATMFDTALQHWPVQRPLCHRGSHFDCGLGAAHDLEESRGVVKSFAAYSRYVSEHSAGRVECRLLLTTTNEC